VTEFSTGITANSGPYGIAAGPDGNLWFTENNANRIGRIGADAPPASVRAPSVTGSGEQNTQQVCQGDQWSPWDALLPSASTSSFEGFPVSNRTDGFEWSRNGSAIAGATTQSYTPVTADVGQQLSCTVTVTYPLLDVTASATSAAVTVIPQNSGPAGTNGTPGPQGSAGAAGPQGPAGEIELVTCTKVKGKKKCTTKLTSSPVTFTASSASATISRASHVYATGSLRDGKLTLHAPKALRAGRYTLALTTGTGKNKQTTKEQVTVGYAITIT
jgi:hypothetical protein